VTAFAQLLDTPGVEEVSELRSRVGFMAYHGGALEAMTDVIAARAAAMAGASFYAVIQPDGMREHLPSIQVSPQESDRLAAFVEHVDELACVGQRPSDTASGLVTVNVDPQVRRPCRPGEVGRRAGVCQVLSEPVVELKRTQVRFVLDAGLRVTVTVRLNRRGGIDAPPVAGARPFDSEAVSVC